MITGISQPKFFDVSMLVPVDANPQAQSIRLATCDIALREAIVLLDSGCQLGAKRRIEAVLAAMQVQCGANADRSDSTLEAESSLPLVLEC